MYFTETAGMHTVNGWTKMYQPAQKPPMKNEMISRISQIINQSGFFIFAVNKNEKIERFFSTPFE